MAYFSFLSAVPSFQHCCQKPAEELFPTLQGVPSEWMMRSAAADRSSTIPRGGGRRQPSPPSPLQVGAWAAPARRGLSSASVSPPRPVLTSTCPPATPAQQNQALPIATVVPGHVSVGKGPCECQQSWEDAVQTVLGSSHSAQRLLRTGGSGP